jgi:preprotein translocase subunit YajC
MLAQATTPAMQPNPNGQYAMMIGYVVIIGFAFYYLSIRPQSRKAKEHAAMLSAMKPGDKVVTSGGVVGTIVSVKDRTVSLRSAETKIEVLKSAVSEITERSGESTAAESQSLKS